MWDRPSQNRFCLVIATTMICGCDPGISKTPTPTSIETTINDAVTLGNNTSTRGSEKPTQQSTSDSAPIPNSATIDNSTNSTASRDSKVAVVPTPQKSIVTPSNEQLARWEQPDFDRMKMLACREWSTERGEQMPRGPAMFRGPGQFFNKL